MHNRYSAPAAPAVSALAAAEPVAEPGFRAPWGELERQIPYVVITTRQWPAEWWRAPAGRSAAARRATAQPAEILAGSTHVQGRSTDLRRPVSASASTRSAARGAGGWDGLAALAAAAAVPGRREIGIKVWDTPEHTSAHDPASARSNGYAHDLPSPAIPDSSDRAPIHEPVIAPRVPSESRAERRTRAKENRRGLFTRLAVVAFGLIVSLIAVETATRRRA
jgi:hypothetical protein